MTNNEESSRSILDGLTLLHHGEHAKALLCILENSDFSVGNHEAARCIGDCLSNISEPGEAIHIFKIFLLSGNKQDKILAMLANVASERPDTKSTIMDIVANCVSQTSTIVAFAHYLAELEVEESRLECALESLKLAMDVDSEEINTLSRIGLIQITLGRAEEGISYILKATTVDPENPAMRYYQGKCLYLLGDYTQAIESFNEYLDKASSDNIANDVDSLLATSYLLSNDLDRSLDYSEMALLKYPEDVGALINASNAYRCLGEIDKSIFLCSKALNLCLQDPRNGESVKAFFNLMFVYGMRGAGAIDATKRLATQFWGSFGINNSVIKEQRNKSASSAKKIKVAFLTSEVGDHVVSYFLESFLAYYPRKKMDVDLLIGTNRYEESATRLISYVSHAIDLSGKSLEENRMIVKERGYDIIVDTSGVTMNSNLAILAHRCAPVQCHYIGYHATLGLETIDYFIADHDFIPDSIHDQFTERIVRIPSPWIARHVPSNLPLAGFSGDSGPVVWLASFNQTAKISITTLDYWASALLAAPQTKLVIKDRFALSKHFQEKVMTRLEERGVAASRISFTGGTASWEDHMRFYNTVDIVLDATPWSAATTAFDAMAMGVPFIAIQGNEASSRMSMSVVKGANHADWIATNEDQYAQIINRICRNIDTYRLDRDKMQAANLESALFSPIQLAENLSSLFLDLATSHQDNA